MQDVELTKNELVDSKSAPTASFSDHALELLKEHKVEPGIADGLNRAPARPPAILHEKIIVTDGQLIIGGSNTELRRLPKLNLE